jgi:thiamine-phosphate pyrophosphorylase
MASRGNTAEPRRPAPRLYLITPLAAEPASLADALSAALGAADVAAVLMTLPAAEDHTLINTIKAIAFVVQQRNVALLLDGHSNLIARSDADGAHLSGIDAFTEALPTLKPDRIAGCGGLASRHDAMLAAEAGADYVMFGDPDRDGRRGPFDAIVERVEWWSEVFEVPCVGYAAAIDEIAPLVAAGADFVAAEFIFSDPRGPAAAAADAGRRLALPEEVG